MIRQRFDPSVMASQSQRDLLRRYAPGHDRLEDPSLSANEAWNLVGEHFLCEDPDAKILAFFGDTAENYNQTTGARRVDILLSDPMNAERWNAHPKLDDRVLEAIAMAFDSVELWGLKTHIFDHEHMSDFDVRRTFRFAAEVSASAHLRAGVTHMGSLRRMIREEFTEALRAYRNDPKLPRKTWTQDRSPYLCCSPSDSSPTSSLDSSPKDDVTPTKPASLSSIFSWVGRWLGGWRR